ncbi:MULTISPECIES: class I SAM-dependent methyltransferase [Pontibacillus]|uniref:Class I SAM-dependent methyltransferase n=1 Tax=Pontibacillus chungwhensis TaxID=265426 RepID=A0ABY8V0U0_9BACI|nr:MULTISPECIES: class I SAM-dependent methyltransferase [Pontibacillus]MCD5325484.1 class I SAM-dependent methyltransferase [Pontibacillus sp. HN14]WIF98596.1 class I SAM-dependent methyltransferase [Pontibacillus chungwhensis]
MSSEQMGAVHSYPDSPKGYHHFIQTCERNGTCFVNKNVLVLGCGSGSFTNALSQHQVHVTGLDRSEEKLKVAKSQNEKIIYRKGDAEHLPFEKDSFDIVVAFGVWHLFDRPKVLSEVSRVLNDKGLLFIAQEAMHSAERQTKILPHFPEVWSKEWQETKWQIKDQWQVQPLPSSSEREKTFFQNDQRVHETNFMEVETSYSCITLKK